jgi:hypothetical protein
MTTNEKDIFGLKEDELKDFLDNSLKRGYTRIVITYKDASTDTFSLSSGNLHDLLKGIEPEKVMFLDIVKHYYRNGKEV